MTQWAMVMDLRRCIGCKTCVMACSQFNRVAVNFWRKVLEFAEPQPPLRQRYFIPTSCMHCQDPPCLAVCPTTATYKRSDGIVAIDYEKCVGCGYCIVACPYHAREIYKGDYDFEEGEIPKKQPTSSPKKERDLLGVCTKCNFCLPRVEKGLADNLVPGKDTAATPKCVVACSCGVLHFGDLDDPESNVSKMLKVNKSMRLSEELGTQPSVYYIL